MRMKRNLKAIPVLVAGLFTSQLSIAAGSVSADPHAGHDMSGFLHDRTQPGSASKSRSGSAGNL